jgi:predicted LPLAT superfamily acyltransferase
MPAANRSLQGALDVAVLLDRGVGRQMTALFEQLNPQLAGRIIDATERGPAVVLRLKEAIEAGQMVGIGADRASDDEAAVLVRFMGGVVRFPEGPWRLAASLGVPVLLGFGLYCGGNRYEARFELFRTRVVLARQSRESDIATLAQAYAARLEYHARRSPYNWFNFYDYWLPEPEPSQ